LPKAGWQGYAPVDIPKTTVGTSKSYAHSQASKAQHAGAATKASW